MTQEQARTRGSRRIAALAVVMIALVGVVLWIASRATEEGPRSATAPAPADSAGSGIVQPAMAADVVPSPGRSPERPRVRAAEPAAPTEAPTRRDAIVSALSELMALTTQWPPGVDDFRSIDMEPLRRVVVRLGITGAELRDVMRDSTLEPALRPVALASFAYAADVGSEDEFAILAVVHDDFPKPGSTFNSARAQALSREMYAGVFALQMNDAQSRLNDAAGHLLAMHAQELPAQNNDSRHLGAFALEGLAGQIDSKVLDATRRLVEPHIQREHNITTAAWGALARAGTQQDAARAVQVAAEGNGHAREGLEHMRDPSASAALESMARSRNQGVYSSYLAESAARGLLSIGTPASLEAFARLSQSSEDPHWAAAWEALNEQPPIRSVGALLTLSITTSEGEKPHPIAPQIAHGIAQIRDRLARSTVPRHEREECLRNVQAVLPQIADRPTALREALHVVALIADDAAWSHLAPERALLPAEESRKLEALRAERR